MMEQIMTESHVSAPIRPVAYDSLDTAHDHPELFGDPFFGVYRKVAAVADHPFAQGENFSYVEPDKWSKPIAHQYLAVVEPQDVATLAKALANQQFRSFNLRLINAIFETPEAFSDVPLESLAEAYVQGIQSPQAAALAAVMSLCALAMVECRATFGRADDDLNDLSCFAYGLDGNEKEIAGFGLSSQEFRGGRFAKSPLTEEEIKAIPYLAGELKYVFELAGQDHGRHAVSVIKKLQDAGFESTAREMAYRSGVVARPVRKYATLDGPSL